MLVLLKYTIPIYPFLDFRQILKYFSVDKLTNASKKIRLALFYRKKGPKMAFDIEDPENPAEMTFRKISTCFVNPLP